MEAIHWKIELKITEEGRGTPPRLKVNHVKLTKQEPVAFDKVRQHAQETEKKTHANRIPKKYSCPGGYGRTGNV